MIVWLLVLGLLYEKAVAGVIPDCGSTTATPPYEIPKVALKLEPINHGSLSETHGQRKPSSPGNPEHGPLSFHLLPFFTTDHPLSLSTSYSSPVKRPYLIVAAPLRETKAGDDSLPLPLPSAWAEKFQPLAPKTVPGPKPQHFIPLPRPEDGAELFFVEHYAPPFFESHIIHQFVPETFFPYY